jgi:hypothetical protein
MSDYPQPKFFGLRCKYCRTARAVLDLGLGIHVEPPCASPGCPDSPPGEGLKFMGPFGFVTLDRERSHSGWIWRDRNALRPLFNRPVESDGWITVHP